MKDEEEHTWCQEGLNYGSVFRLWGGKVGIFTKNMIGFCCCKHSTHKDCGIKK